VPQSAVNYQNPQKQNDDNKEIFHNTAWTIAPRTTSTTIGGSKIQANPSIHGYLSESSSLSKQKKHRLGQ
jgi:hypothetical protein